MSRIGPVSVGMLRVTFGVWEQAVLTHLGRKTDAMSLGEGEPGSVYKGTYSLVKESNAAGGDEVGLAASGQVQGPGSMRGEWRMKLQQPQTELQSDAGLKVVLWKLKLLAPQSEALELHESFPVCILDHLLLFLLSRLKTRR